MLTTYTTDGSRTRFTFNWPYLDRSHIMVTRNGAPALFKFIGDGELEVHTLFGEALPAGEALKIFRATPDIVGYAEFQDSAKLTATDLNRARLQILFLVQERSGGLGGSVAQAVANLTNEITTISGALDSLDYSMGILMNGLQTLDELGQRIVVVKNEADALRTEINQAIADFDASKGEIHVRVDGLEASRDNMRASFAQQVAVLAAADFAQASRVDALEASLTSPDGEDELLAAALIESAIAQVKGDTATVKRVETLEARRSNDNASALVQVEREARVAADGALALQITTLQTTIGQNLAQVQQNIQTNIDVVNGKVTHLNAQYVLKAGVTRPDGKQITAGIGLAATSNGTISQSEIILMADRLVFVDSTTNPNAPLKPMLVAGNVDGSPTFIIPSNRMGDQTYPGRVLVDGTVEGRHAKFDTFTGNHMKVGSVTARELNVNMGVNLLKNSPLLTADEWGFYSSTPGATAGQNAAGDGWRPFGGHTLTIHQPNTATTGVAIWYTDVTAPPVNTRVEFSAYTGAHRCTAAASIECYSATGAFTGGFGSQNVNVAEAYGGRSITDFKRVFGFGVVPANTAFIRLVVSKTATNSGTPDSWLMFTQPMLAEALPNQTRPSPYGPSGLGTKITPAGVTTPSLSALSPNLGLIVNGRMVSADGKMTVDMDGKQVLMQNNGYTIHLHLGGFAMHGPSGQQFIYDTNTGQLSLTGHINATSGTFKGHLAADAFDAVSTLNVAGGAITGLRYAAGGDSPGATGTYLVGQGITMVSGSSGVSVEGLVSVYAVGESESGSIGGMSVGLYRDDTGALLDRVEFNNGTALGRKSLRAFDPYPLWGWTAYSVRVIGKVDGFLRIGSTQIYLMGAKR